mgnify:CR=1 FL=1
MNIHVFMQEGQQREMNLGHQVQRMQTELNEKDFELNKVETRNAWAGEQQQEILDKLKEALNEKNRTIEVSLICMVPWLSEKVLENIEEVVALNYFNSYTEYTCKG